MTTIVKIRPFSLRKLNNAEYGAFMDSFAQIIEHGTIAKLGIVEADWNAFKANLNKMIDANMQVRKDENSAKLVQLDEERDQLLTYFFTKIAAEMRSPDPAIKEAAIQLGVFLGQYRGIQKKANRQETQLIKGLLLDAQQAKYLPHFQTLKLDMVFPKLKKLNEDYESLLEQRTNEGVLTMAIATKSLREEMNLQYEELTTKLFALNIIAPVPESAKAITELNNLIKATMIAWRQRNGVVHLKPEEEDEEPTSE